MTLCIAATCHQAGEPRIVLCFDAKGSSDFGSTETIWKYERLTPRYGALVAGTVSESRELADIYRQRMRDVPTPLDLSALLDYLREPSREFRRRKITDLLIAKCGQNVDQFEASDGNDQLRYDIANMPCTTWLTVAGFAGNKPVLFEYWNWCVYAAEHYSAIGEGSSIALPLLKYRSQADYDTLSSTLYKVYEAKKVAEIYNSVGAETKMIVLEPGRNGGPVNERVVDPIKGLGFLEEQFVVYGPKRFSALHDFPVEYLL